MLSFMITACSYICYIASSLGGGGGGGGGGGMSLPKYTLPMAHLLFSYCRAKSIILLWHCF